MELEPYQTGHGILLPLKSILIVVININLIYDFLVVLTKIKTYTPLVDSGVFQALPLYIDR